MNGEGAKEIVHSTPPAADVNPVPNIKTAEEIHSDHIPEFSNPCDDSPSDGKVPRQLLRPNSSN